MDRSSQGEEAQQSKNAPDEADIPPRAHITAKTRKHILDGDETGGGHREGTGKRGKSEFPANWSDDKIIQEIENIANDPSIKALPSHDLVVKKGRRDGVDMKVVIDPEDGEIVTGYPTNARRNP